jgi:hypothetical protein
MFCPTCKTCTASFARVKNQIRTLPELVGALLRRLVVHLKLRILEAPDTVSTFVLLAIYT